MDCSNFDIKFKILVFFQYCQKTSNFWPNLFRKKYICLKTSQIQWKGINCKQSTRWQHLSRLKASAFLSLQIFFSFYETQQHILGTGTAIWWVTEPHLKHVSNHSATQYQLKISGLFPPAITGQDDNMCCMIPCVNTTMSSLCLE